jgi:hypothetical protein
MERINDFPFDDEDEENCDGLQNIQWVHNLPVPSDMGSANGNWKSQQSNIPTDI